MQKNRSKESIQKRKENLTRVYYMVFGMSNPRRSYKL